MSIKIWLVGGTTGEYSDRVEWVVDAWRSKEEAEARITELKRLMQELGVNADYFQASYEVRQEREEKMREHDPAFHSDYSGTEYYICELELKP